MVQWVYERALKAGGLDRLLVATDDERIHRAVEAFGGEARMTSADCPSGTDRVNQAVGDLSCDVVLNLQGDEPALDPLDVESLIDLMESDSSLCMGTLVAPIRDHSDYENPDVVKVVMGAEGRCVYFSRSPVPFLRGRTYEESTLWRHVGIYAFRRDFLREFTSWPPGDLERAESLEQLRAVERGVEIRAAVARDPGCGVDLPEDVPRAEAILRSLGEGAE